MTARRIVATVMLTGTVIVVSTGIGVALGLRALDRWLSAPARQNHPDVWLGDLYHRPARKP